MVSVSYIQSPATLLPRYEPVRLSQYPIELSDMCLEHQLHGLGAKARDPATCQSRPVAVWTSMTFSCGKDRPRAVCVVKRLREAPRGGRGWGTGEALSVLARFLL